MSDITQGHRMAGRAYTPEEKRAILNRIYVVWLQKPSQRLGQLLENSTDGLKDMFYIEDTQLAEACEEFVERTK